MLHFLLIYANNISQWRKRKNAEVIFSGACRPDKREGHNLTILLAS